MMGGFYYFCYLVYLLVNMLLIYIFMKKFDFFRMGVLNKEN